jgi:hypothetical protein
MAKQAKKPSRDERFDGMIGPGPLRAWVQSSCPFLVLPKVPATARPSDLIAGPQGYLSVLAAADFLAGKQPSPATREDYLALCLAAHHASVGSFVPTDVDSKIRGELWKRASGDTLRRRWAIARAAFAWSTDGVSTRVEHTPFGPVSGHDGEWQGVANGALGAALLARDETLVEEIAAWIRADLTREAAAFTAQIERARNGDTAEALILLRLAWILTHNVGDVDQGLSYWTADAIPPDRASDPQLIALRHEFAELAHERPERYAGVFHHAKRIYQLVAAEGHRHYPLREAKCLRRCAALLLPLGPCFEAWGRAVATSTDLGDADRADVLVALLDGIRAVRGQRGYQRAIVGLSSCRGGLPNLLRRLPTSVATALNHPELSAQIAVSETNFADGLAQQVRELLA